MEVRDGTLVVKIAKRRPRTGKTSFLDFAICAIFFPSEVREMSLRPDHIPSDRSSLASQDQQSLIQASCSSPHFDGVNFSIEFHQSVEGFHLSPLFLFFRNKNN